MSKRSPMLLAFAGGLFVALDTDVTGDAAEKSPQSPPKLSFRGADAGCIGVDGTGGCVSKNEPPLRADLETDVCRVWPDGEVRPANGDGFAAGCWGEVKDSEVNASFIPPKALLGCAWAGEERGGDCMHVNAPMFDCGCC